MSVFLNGEFLKLEDARVSVLDRGFLFGDGVYELMPVYGGHLFRPDAHLARLARSLAQVMIPNPYDDLRWRNVFSELVQRAGGGDLLLYWQLTRGVAPRDHAFPRWAEPTVFAMANPPLAPVFEQLERGVKAIVLEDIRWDRCDIKATSLLGNILLRQQAIEADATEAILMRHGWITEGAASNVFAVLDGVIVTPPNGPTLLPGVTRDLVLELIGTAGLSYREAMITERELRHAQEIWITSSAKELLAVTTLDGVRVGNGAPGALWRQAYECFQDYKARARASEVI